ncbi:hypothetical protein B566_EDAN007871 [Ephemera danica]|nr:hypothetical protein B566_EDAN007871 [Ephemera danica]
MGIPANEAVFAPEKSRLNTSVRPELSYISNITILLDDPVIAVRNQAAIGLCKLLLSGRLNSALLLSRLILLWFNPANASNKILMRVLGMFFSVYPSHHSEAPRHLTAALLPTLDLLLEAPHFSPLLDIEPKDIGLFILDLARPGRNKYYTANAHDAMAQILLERVLDEPAGDAVALFLRLCINLQISLDDDAVRLPLLSLAKRIKRGHDGPKGKEMNKLLDMLRGQDDPSSQESQLMSQDSQESSEGKENEVPQFRYGILGESEPMEWEHEETTPRPLRRSRQHSIPLGSTPRPLRRRRHVRNLSDTDSD